MRCAVASVRRLERADARDDREGRRDRGRRGRGRDRPAGPAHGALAGRLTRRREARSCRRRSMVTGSRLRRHRTGRIRRPCTKWSRYQPSPTHMMRDAARACARSPARIRSRRTRRRGRRCRRRPRRRTSGPRAAAASNFRWPVRAMSAERALGELPARVGSGRGHLPVRRRRSRGGPTTRSPSSRTRRSAVRRVRRAPAWPGPTRRPTRRDSRRSGSPHRTIACRAGPIFGSSMPFVLPRGSTGRSRRAASSPCRAR